MSLLHHYCIPITSCYSCITHLLLHHYYISISITTSLLHHYYNITTTLLQHQYYIIATPLLQHYFIITAVLLPKSLLLHPCYIIIESLLHQYYIIATCVIFVTTWSFWRPTSITTSLLPLLHKFITSQFITTHYYHYSPPNLEMHACGPASPARRAARVTRPCSSVACGSIRHCSAEEYIMSTL